MIRLQRVCLLPPKASGCCRYDASGHESFLLFLLVFHQGKIWRLRTPAVYRSPCKDFPAFKGHHLLSGRQDGGEITSPLLARSQWRGESNATLAGKLEEMVMIL